MYQAFLEQKLTSYITQHQTNYDSMVPKEFQESKDISTLLNLETQYKQIVTALSSARPMELSVDLVSQINDSFKEAIAQHATKRQLIDAKYEAAISELQTQRTDKLNAATKRASAGIQPLVDKHNKLLSYKEGIKSLCNVYGITPLDTQISKDISVQEFEALLDASIIGCESMVKQTSKRNPLTLLYKPEAWEGKPLLQVVVITAFLVAFHNFGGIAALIFFFYMFKSTIGIYKRVEMLKIAEALMYTPDFDIYMQKDEIESIPDVDTTQADAIKESEIAEWEKSDPQIKRSEALKLLNSDIESIGQQVETAKTQVQDLYNTKLQLAQTRLKWIMKTKEEELAKLKKFGTFMLDGENVKYYPSYNFYLGKLNNVIEQRVPVPRSNIIFNSAAQGMTDFLKLMICNMFLDIKEKHLNITIYDPVGYGQDFAEFLTQAKDLDPYIELNTGEFQEILRKSKDNLVKNVRLCGNRTLDDFNKEAEEKGMVYTQLHLIIAYSGFNETIDKGAWDELLRTSHQFGVIFWLFYPQQKEGLHMFNKPYDINGIKIPLPYSYELGSQCTATYATTVRESKSGGIDYFSSIHDKYITREKWGTWSTNDGIDLNFGLADGDPSKGYPMPLCDANVHLLMAGQSGAGKSAAINQMLLSLLTKYSPKELMMVMVDFKNVEFSTFTQKDPVTGKRISIIPHARILAGTKDGEYALSVFDFLIGEMENRQKILGDVGAKKLADYNDLMTQQGHPEKRLPRILLLVDEFQVMFTEVDNKIVDVIQGRIRSLAKLARAFGCHMWFTSQSMEGTMSKDVKDNFSMRAALRCTADVSSSIIGNPAAGGIKEKFGYLITNDSTGQDPTRNTLWRVPFVETKKILSTFEAVGKLYKERGEEGHYAEFYDESLQHMDAELFDFYEKNKENSGVANPHLMVMGRRTNFHLNNAPVNFFLNKGDNEHVLIAASEDADRLNLFRTIFDNIKAHGSKFVINAADEDAFTLLDLDNIVPENMKDWAQPSVAFADWINPEKSPLYRLIKSRADDSTKIKGPMFVLLYNWDKLVGFGVNEHARNTDAFNNMMRTASTVDIHFLIFVRTKASIGAQIMAQFKHKLCAFLDESTAMRIMDNTRANKLPSAGGFAFYQRGNDMTKFKIYQHTFTRKLAEKELKL